MIYGISAYVVLLLGFAIFIGKFIKFGGSNKGRSDHTMSTDHDRT